MGAERLTVGGCAKAVGLRGGLVRLRRAGARPPVTPVEQLMVATLQQEGPISLDRLVERVALALYREALKKGGSVLDLGFFGSDLFVPDVARELKAGDGILWEIELADGRR